MIFHRYIRMEGVFFFRGGISVYHTYRNYMPRATKAKEINVIGTGTKIAKSDMIILVFDLINENKDPLEAKQSNEKLIDAALGYSAEFGIREEDIFYTRNELIPIYDENGEIIKYKASTVFKLLFYDIDTASEYLYNIRPRHVIVEEVLFTIKDPIGYYNEALEVAIHDAYDKATKVAEKMEVIIDRTPQNLTETTDMHDLLVGASYHYKGDPEELKEGFITMLATVEAKFLVGD